MLRAILANLILPRHIVGIHLHFGVEREVGNRSAAGDIAVFVVVVGN